MCAGVVARDRAFPQRSRCPREGRRGGDGAFLTSWNAIIADQTTVEARDAAFSLSFVLGNVASGVGLVLPLALPGIQDATCLDSGTVHLGLMGVLALGSGITSPAT